jgi:hypothetical protein
MRDSGQSGADSVLENTTLGTLFMTGATGDSEVGQCAAIAW